MKKDSLLRSYRENEELQKKLRSFEYEPKPASFSFDVLLPTPPPQLLPSELTQVPMVTRRAAAPYDSQAVKRCCLHVAASGCSATDNEAMQGAWGKQRVDWEGDANTRAPCPGAVLSET